MKLSLIAKDLDTANCPLCKDELTGKVIKCRGCGTEAHTECMDDMGGCPSLGCEYRGKKSAVNYAMGCKNCQAELWDKHDKNCPSGGFITRGRVEPKHCPKLGDIQSFKHKPGKK